MTHLVLLGTIASPSAKLLKRRERTQKEHVAIADLPRKASFAFSARIPY